MKKILYVLIFIIIVIVVLFAVFASLNRVTSIDRPKVDLYLKAYTRPVKLKNPNIVRILSIDGGGVRGVIPLEVLTYIEKQSGEPISQLFDFIAGTSTGAIIATRLTLPNGKAGSKYSAKYLNIIGIDGWQH